MSLDAVAQQLKLAPRQVRALEDDDWQRLPGRTFVRGFSRNYARFVRLDPDAVLAALPMQRSRADPARVAPALADAKARRWARCRRANLDVEAALHALGHSAGARRHRRGRRPLLRAFFARQACRRRRCRRPSASSPTRKPRRRRPCATPAPAAPHRWPNATSTCRIHACRRNPRGGRGAEPSASALGGAPPTRPRLPTQRGQCGRGPGRHRAARDDVPGHVVGRSQGREGSRGAPQWQPAGATQTPWAARRRSTLSSAMRTP